MTTEQYANGAASTLNGAITAAATSLVVGSAASFPATPNFRIRVDNEIMLVTAVAGTTCTVTRAAEALAGVQVAASHANGAAVIEVLTATQLAAIQAKCDGVVSASGTGYQPYTAGVPSGVAQDYISVGTTLGAGFHPALTGLIRLPNLGAAYSETPTTGIMFRNAANTADVPAMQLDSANTLYIGNAVADTRGSSTLRYGASGNHIFDVSGSTPVQINATGLTMGSGAIITGYVLSALALQGTQQVFDGATNPTQLIGQRPFGTATVNTHSGAAQLMVVQLGSATPQAVVEAAEPVAGQRVAALCQMGAGVTATQMPLNTGDGVVYVANATTVPTASAVGGGILFVQAGALKYRGSSGTITTIALA